MGFRFPLGGLHSLDLWVRVQGSCAVWVSGFSRVPYSTVY